MRINQYVASASKLSRRNADKAISDGRVTINGLRATIGTLVSPTDRVELDGVNIQPPKRFEYVAYHKPVGLVVSRASQSGNKTIYQQLPTHLHALQPVGRLDKDSSGLLLLTNDGQFAQQATHPSFNKHKIYEVQLNNPIKPTDVRKLIDGVYLDDGSSRMNVISTDDKQITVGLHEGRNRQVRRTFDALGYKVVSLHRTTFGGLDIGSLKPGDWRTINPQELI